MKRRILSMFLSAVMAASCIPAASLMPVSADTAVNANLIAGAVMTGAAAQKTKAADNTASVAYNDYLHMYNRRYNSNDDGFIVYFTLTDAQAADTVYVEFDMRHSQPSSDGSKATTRPNYNGKGNIGADAHIPNADGTWSHIKLEAKSMKAGSNYIRFIKNTSTNQTHPLDLDNFVVYTKSGDTVLDTRNKSYESFVLNGTFASFGKAKITAATETEYFRASAADGANTEISFELENSLAVGYYRLSADVRLGDFTCSGNKVNGAYDGTYVSGANDAVLTAAVGGDAVGTYDITPEWQRIESVFYVSGNADAVKLSENGNQPFDVRNISLTYEGEDVTETYDAGLLEDAAFDFDYTEVASVNSVDGINRDSTYMTVEERGYGQFVIANLTLDEKPVKDRTYYVSCYARSSVQGVLDANGTNKNFTFRLSVNTGITEAVYGSDNFLMATANSGGCSNRNNIIKNEASGTKHDGCQLDATTDWTYYETKFTPTKSGSDNIVLTIKRGPNSIYHHGFDVDGFKVWYVEDGEVVVIYNNSFDAEGSAKDFKTATASFSTSNIIESDYKRVSAGDESTALKFVFAESLTAGYYTFDGDMRLGIFNAGNGADNVAAVRVTDDAGNEVGSFDIGTTWDHVDKSLLIKEDTDTLILTADCGKPVEFDNLSLILEQPIYTTVDEKNNLLSGAVRSASGMQKTGTVIGTDNTTVDANRYLTVGEREWGTSNFMTIQLDEKPVVGRTYYVSMNSRVSTECDTNMIIRLRTNISNSESVYGRSNQNFLFPTENDETSNNYESVLECEANGVLHDGSNFAFGEEWKYIEAKFTPDEASNSNITLTFTRGTNSAYIMPFDIDNFRVWYVENGNEVAVFASDFETSSPVGKDETGKTVERFQSSTAKLGVETDTAYTVIESTKGVNTALTYELGALTFEDGVYSVSCDFKIEGFEAVKGAVNTQNIVTVFTLSDGTVKESDPVALTSAWTNVSAIIKLLDGVKPVEVSFVLDGDGELAYRNNILTFHTSLYDNGIPNIGIVMMLLAKKAGDSRTFERTVEFIDNGDFAAEPVIFNSAPAKVQTVESAGWYAKSTDKVGTTLTYVTEGDNSFIRITELDTSQRGIFWNTGVVLKPGTYTVKMDMRVSETEDSAAYSAKKWRNDKKSTMSVRANLGDPNASFSPHYAAFSPVDLDSPMNAQGQVYGNCQTITREWTTYTDTVVIDRELLAVFKIGGGTGGEVDSHGFDIDNISITSRVRVNSAGEIVAEEEKKPVNKNLIANGSFDEAPTVISGDAYKANESGAWFPNDGMGYKKDNTGKDITSEPMIRIDHKITWTDGYLTFSGRTNNLRQFWFNSGVTLKPGNYKFSIDLKAANEGEKTSIRFGIPGLFNPTVDDAVTVDSSWQTVTVGLAVKNDTAVRLNIWGGPGASFIHDFCVDNVVIEKLS